MLTRRAAVGLGIASLAPGQQASKGKLFSDAAAYEGYIGRWSRKLAPQLVAFSGIADGGNVLDVGCGTGALTAAILDARPQCRVSGIDPASEYIAYARAHLHEKRAEFEVGDAQKMRFPAATFDAASSLLVFNFIPDPALALAETRRVTKPGGPISAAVWDYGGGMRMLRVFFDAAVAVNPAAEALDEKHMPLSQKGELGALWRKGGLRDVTETALEFEMRFQSFADYWSPFLAGQGPAGRYVASLDAQARQQLEDRLRATLPSPLVLPARAWAVRGLAQTSTITSCEFNLRRGGYRRRP
jgi:SAM-dependent methyltransferase